MSKKLKDILAANLAKQKAKKAAFASNTAKVEEKPRTPTAQEAPKSMLLSSVSDSTEQEPEDTETASNDVSLEQLADYDTSQKEESDPQVKMTHELRRAELQGKAQTMKTEGELKILLDRFDERIADEDIAYEVMADAREYVKRIMLTLHTYPEFMGIVIDRDVHNVMRFIRSVREEQLKETYKSRRKKAVNKAKKGIKDTKTNRFAAAMAKQQEESDKQFEIGDGLSL